MRLIKKIFCRHTYLYLGRFKCFSQSPFHKSWVGWAYEVDLKKCIKCGKEITTHHDI